MTTARRVTLAVLGALLGGTLAGCQPPTPLPARAEIATPEPLPLHTSVKDLMGGLVAFSTHVIRRMESSEIPLSTSDWGTARLAAADVTASATLLTMPNKNILDSLRRQDENWWPLSQALQEAGLAAGEAARAKDRAALSRAFRELEVACQSCHAHFKVHGQ